MGGLGTNIRIDVQINLFDDFTFRKLRNPLLEKVCLKALLGSSKPNVPECFEILRFRGHPKPLQKTDGLVVVLGPIVLFVG